MSKSDTAAPLMSVVFEMFQLRVESVEWDRGP